MTMAAEVGGGNLVVERVGLGVITDLGRTRGPSAGLPVNGAMDRYSAVVANILVTNRETDPVIEVTVFDFAIRTEADLLVAVTGAPMTVRVDDVEQRMWQPISVRAGQRLSLSTMTTGMRTYIAVNGSFDVPRLLGSCAPDTVAGFGTVLSAGSTLSARRSVPPIVNPYLEMSLFRVDVAVPDYGGEPVVDVTDGPDIAEFEGTAHRLFENAYLVTPSSNHIGLRMTGSLPVRVRSDEMISRGVPVGAVEVPPGDELLVLHRGRGVTAGYPVLAVATPAALDDLGQVRPGQTVRFRRVGLDRAIQDSHAWRGRLDQLTRRVDAIYSSLGFDSTCTQQKGSRDATQRL